MENFAAVNKVYAEFFTAEPKPVRTVCLSFLPLYLLFLLLAFWGFDLSGYGVMMVGVVRGRKKKGEKEADKKTVRSGIPTPSRNGRRD